MPVTYEPDPADLALSSVPGQEMFDPRKRKFSAEELKPQPMIKKARKVFIPEDLKVRRHCCFTSVSLCVSLLVVFALRQENPVVVKTQRCVFM